MGPVSSARDSLMCWNVAEKSNNAATVHEQCMNSSRNSEIFLLKRVQKKKKKKKENTKLKSQTQIIPIQIDTYKILDLKFFASILKSPL